MGKALYRVYRPKKLSEVVGQEHITKTLENALKQGRISHAYLFTGPRGVGKTSVARIWAHEINGLPYNDDSPHFDIIEIDAASNRRIDEIRELRDRVAVAPTSAKYKVYIIDEVHMLTKEAFNALLKTLEEPPSHVIFILATTDAHKLPQTIISRTQRFSFRPVDKAQVVERLGQIAKQEKLKIDSEALELLAEHGEGSFRDSISLLDQAGSHGQITLEAVQQLLGVPSEASLRSLILAATTEAGTPAELMKNITGLYDQGYQASAIAKSLASMLRLRLVNGEIDQSVAFELLSGLIEVPAAHDPERYLELLLLKSQSQLMPSEPPKAPVQVQASPEEPKAEPKALPDAKAKPLDELVWSEVLQTLKKRHNTLYGVVRMAEPDFSKPGVLQLRFAFAFHQKRLNENANRQKLADIVEELTGQSTVVEVIHDKAAKPPEPAIPAEMPPAEHLAAISNIFGNAELIES